MILEPVDSIVIFKHFWWCWRALGIRTGYTNIFFTFYDFLLNIFITIYYPLHLTIGLFIDSTQADIFKNLAINVTCIACSFKHFCFRYKLRDIERIQVIFAELDKRAVAVDERRYFAKHTKVDAFRISNLFVIVYVTANVSAAIAVVLGSERRLMYPAWFPFDWKSNAWFYAAALIYQFVGISIQIVQNLANDIYAPMSLCIFAGHVRLLSMRVAKIGHDPVKTKAQNDEELIACIEDHKRLLNIFNLLQGTFSLAQLGQFLSSGLIICIVLTYLLFFVDNIFAYIYYTVYFIAMTVEIFPCCYYGSVLELEFEALTYAIFNSNWLEQTRNFRQNQLIFTELSLKKITPVAGGMVNVHLTAFFATCKMAYSLFAVITQMK